MELSCHFGPDCHGLSSAGTIKFEMDFESKDVVLTRVRSLDINIEQ